MTKCIPQSSLNRRLPREINPMMRFKPKLSATNNQSKKPTTRIRKSKLFREHTNKTSALLSKRALSRTTWCSRPSLTRPVSLSRQTQKNQRHQILPLLRKVDILLKATKRAPMSPLRSKRAHLVRPRTLRSKKLWARSCIRPTFKSLFKRLTKASSRILSKNCQLSLSPLSIMDSATVKLNIFVSLLTRSGRNMIQTTVVRLTRSRPRTS